MDKATTTGERISYARIFVEINVNSEFKKSVKLQVEEGDMVEIAIEYEWMPPVCKQCNSFGHVESLRPTKRVWRKKHNLDDPIAGNRGKGKQRGEEIGYCSEGNGGKKESNEQRNVIEEERDSEVATVDNEQDTDTQIHEEQAQDSDLEELEAVTDPVHNTGGKENETYYLKAGWEDTREKRKL